MKIDYNTQVSANYALNMLGKPYDVALQHFSRALNIQEAYKEVVNGDTAIIYQIGSSIAHIATGAFELIPCVNIVILYVDRFFNNRYETFADDNFKNTIPNTTTILYDPEKGDNSLLGTLTLETIPANIAIIPEDLFGRRIKISEEMFDKYLPKRIMYPSAEPSWFMDQPREINFVCPILSSRSRDSSEIVGYLISHERYTDENLRDNDYGYSKTLLLKIGEKIFFKQDNVRGMGILNTKIYGSYKPASNAPFDEFIFNYSLDNFLSSRKSLQKQKMLKMEKDLIEVGICKEVANIITEYASGLSNYMKDGHILGNLNLTGEEIYSSKVRKFSREKVEGTCILY
jgi:hypothetical protein